MSDVTFVSSRAQTLDGTTYTISVYRQPGGYFAFWECKRCGNQSPPAVPADTGEGAIRECERLIKTHHSQLHQYLRVEC